ncbi:MAG: HYR domain-containing protein, partial [Bacteroidales bacterium]
GAKKNSENGHYAGMAYMFVKPETGWTDTTETAQLQPSDAVAEDAFACDVGIYNERIVIGSELSDPNGMSSGSIYIFDRPLSGWDSMVETQKLTPENNGMGHYFGNSVNVYENFGIASAPGAVSSQGSSGAVFVFSMIKPAYIEQPKNLENICPEADTVIKTIVENYDTISWEISVDSGQSFNTIEEGGLFEGYDTPRLSFSASESLDSALFRCKITNYVHSVYSDTVSFYLDRIAPIIENLEAQSLVVDENCSVPLPDYTADLAITDNCNQEFTIEQSPTAGTNLTVGSYLVTINAVDSMGNYSEMVFDVDVKDTLAPLPDLNELPNITEECKIIELSAPTATDACEGEITGRHDADLPILTQGTHTVTWSYDDGNGNITTQEQRLIVEDSTLPSITCPGDQSINLEDGQSEYVVEGNEFDPTADDNCELADIVNDYNNSETLTGAKLPKGTTKVTWTAADVAGNTKKCSFDVTVNKTSASQNPTENNILVYPNPTRGKLYLEFEELNIQKIIVKDINGKTVGNFNHSDTEKLNNLTIDLSTKPAGTYILKIRYKSGVYLEKIIKQ